ncbi:MAG: 2-hydroxychromene-2-carboxylate isomerase [Rhodospirillaceae bacterium]|nr:2-hydroxychromene-2-carboxylate isomerase [Rhodospirillaceae bacterium]MBT6828780.1 2-hydroxychromene-2-carboxylate isomerase [Rhodospirillaceae bacterium]
MSPTIEVFYSFRSPYCYLLTRRLVALAVDFDAAVLIRPVYPIAVRDPEFFSRVDPLYRPYHLQDSARLAEFYGIPYRRPQPDPIVQDLESGHIAASQPYIRRITRMAQAAADDGKGLEYACAVMTLLWDGDTDNWHEGEHLAKACGAAGLDFAALDARAGRDADALDAAIESNQEAQRAAGHWGVPLMVFNGEPFYGQDRFDLLCWRLAQ